MARRLNLEREPSSKSSSKLKLTFLTLFPEFIESALKVSLLGRAQKAGILKCKVINIRDFAADKHKSVDDRPYGGGEGMLLRVDVLHAAWKSAVGKGRSKKLTVLLSPQGETFSHAQAEALACEKEIIFVCGHYEGVDERFIELCVDRQISIGNYVLTGGELPALVLADSISRFMQGVVGDEGSVKNDTFSEALGGGFKYPQFTRPRAFQGKEVPSVLLSGDHGLIEKWRKQNRRAKN